MRKIDVNDAIDNNPFGRFQWTVVALCALLLIVDGYDVFVAGTVLPTLIAEWGLTKPQAGVLQAWALFGMMFGALIFGPLADRIGRKKGIAISFLVFTLATLLTGFANSPDQFKVFRFIAGLGCGGLMPNAVALMNEYAPKRMRGTMVALMFSGYSVGGMVAAALGIGLIPHYGWEPMFFAAAVPLLLLPFVLWKLPESLGFLIRQGEQEKAQRIYARIVPSARLESGDTLVFTESKGASASIAELFRHQRTLRTLMLWLAFFCCLLLVYLLSSWLPKVLQEAGYAEKASLLSLFSLNFGGMAGAVAGGWLGDRLGLPKVVVGYFIAAAASIALMLQSAGWPAVHPGFRRRCQHHRHADPALCQRCAALQPFCPLDGTGLGFRCRAHRRHRWTDARRRAAGQGTAAPAEFPDLRHPRDGLCTCHAGLRRQ